MNLAPKLNAIIRASQRCFLPIRWKSITKQHHLDSTIKEYAKLDPSLLNLKTWVEFGKNPSEGIAYKFLVKRLPVRLAKVIEEIKMLPHSILNHESVCSVLDSYYLTFNEVLRYNQDDWQNREVLHKFRDLVSLILDRHREDVMDIGKAVINFRNTNNIDMATEQQINWRLDNTYITKISMRMLLNQYILMFSPNAPSKSAYVGFIDEHCSISNALNDAYEDAKFLCLGAYNIAPDLKVETFRNGQQLDAKEEITMVYIPSHIHHILFEVFKNSMRAQCEIGQNVYTKNPEDADLHPIHVIISQGKNDVSIRISDRGGGIPYSLVKKAFNYAFTTAGRPDIITEDGRSEGSRNSSPIAGFGYGLPLARLYARYFNGDVVIKSVDGYGTDAYVYLKNSPAEALEIVPSYTPLRRFFNE